LALAITVLAACERPAPTPAVDLAAEEQAIRTQGEQLLAREQAKDADGALTFYTDDAVALMPGAAAVTTKDALRSLYQEFFTTAGMTSLQSTVGDIDVAASGDLAVEHGVNVITFTTPQGEMTDTGKYLVVWKKVDGQWKVARISVNSDSPPPGAPAPGAPPTTTGN
jgi:uncharacterized protein (TIGR02246 family)